MIAIVYHALDGYCNSYPTYKVQLAKLQLARGLVLWFSSGSLRIFQVWKIAAPTKIVYLSRILIFHSVVKFRDSRFDGYLSG